MSTFVPQNRWPKTPLAAHYLAFATRVRELVHPEAQDIYRVHALSTLEKLRELGRCCSEVSSGQYPRKALDPIVAEVEEALRSDPIVKKIAENKGIQPAEIMPSNENSTEELNSIGRLWFDLLQRDYRKTIESEIINLLSDCQQKKALLLLAKQYIALLIGYGYHRQHILVSAEDIFFSKDIGKCTTNRVKRFFDRFPEGARSYTILILGDKESIERASIVFELPVCGSMSEAEEMTGADLSGFSSAFSGKQALVFSEGKGIDPFNAAKRLQLIFALPKYFNVVYPSKDIVSIGQECIVVDSKSM